MKLNFSITFLVLSATMLAQPTSVLLNPFPSRILGHPQRQLVTAAANYVEGRELTTPQGIAIDRSGPTPILYIADTGNHRVLAWRNPLNAANGAPADLVIGQRDRFTTTANGPGTNFTTGLNQPTGLAVDSQGNLFVADTNNNRILRYPRPFDQPSGQLLEIDVMLGQETFGSASGGNTGRLPNRGRTSPAADTLFFSNFNQVFRVRMAFDAGGNLWVTDPGNHRVVRYPASRLTPGNFGPQADVFLGQLNSISNTQGTDRLNKSTLSVPSGLAIAEDGRLYVADGRARVLVFRNPTSTGAAADRILGVPTQVPGQPALPPINDQGLGSPEGIFVVNNVPYVVDAALHRIVRYGPPDSWTPESPTAFSPRMTDVIGQPDFNSGDTNRGNRVPGPLGFNTPVDGVVFNGHLFVVDSSNHRVVVIPGGGTFNAPANRVFGQLDLDLNAPNLVEGREFFFAGIFQNRQYRGGGIALDGNILYVADTLNNRVLGFRDVRSVTLGKPADLVIGQVSLTRTTINSPDGNQNIPNQTGLFLPHAVAVDGNGDLYIADTLNSRVVRYPRPFDNLQNLRPNLVLGQSSFTSKIQDASPRNMSAPVSLAFTVGGDLVVSDNAHNRVLLFTRPPGGDFTNGQAAAAVFGQPDFISTGASNDPRRMNGPRGVTVDVDDRMYVVDAGNNRLHIYDRVTLAGNDPSPALTLTGFNSPLGVHSDPRTAELWVTDGNNGRALRFPAYGQLSITSQPNLQTGSIVFPLDIKVDRNSNLVMSDVSNRIAFYYQAQVSVNGANQQNPNLAPGTIASMYSQGGVFADELAVASTASLPRLLADTEVLFNDQPAPLFFVSPNQINYQIPWSASPGTFADVTVVKKSTGQVMASSFVRIDPVSPGFFTATANGRGQISALNQDNTVNSINNPVARGQVIQLYGTGIGAVSNTPADGEPSPSSPLAEGQKPDVVINGRIVPGSDVLFSGLAPGFVGLWQLNVRIPDFVPPGNNISVLVLLRSVPSQNNLGTVIAVKQ
jgi:uncharacterized protein (TIGR03437 family)